MRNDNPKTHDFAPLLQRFFVDYLMNQRRVSGQTVAAYRDTFRLLLAFAERELGTKPTSLCVNDLTAECILQFLDHLETERHNCVRSRNARCAAIHSFMHYVGLREPALLAHTQPIMAIPMKRFERPLVGFLAREHIEALLNAPDPTRFSGQRDRVMFTTLYNTGARVSELTGMRVADLSLIPGASLHIRGKGRKQRTVPLWARTSALLRHWLDDFPRMPEQPLFPNRAGGALTRTSVVERLKLAARIATKRYPELAKQRITPHIVRHSTAMHLLQAGVDINVIALWLGHESPATTHTYIEADLAMKQRALDALQPPNVKGSRYRPSDPLLQFLQAL